MEYDHKSVVMICGTARSGSTMLDLMLGSPTRAFSCGEVYAWFRPWRKHHSVLSCSCNDEPCETWEQLKNMQEAQFHSKVLHELGYDYVVDSSKSLNWVMDAFQWGSLNHFTVKPILIWKDPVSLAYSFWKRNRDDWRRKFVQYHIHILSSGLPFVSVNHGELSRAPESTLKQICSQLDLPFDAAMLQFWEGSHHHLFGSDGTRRQVEHGASTVKGDDYPADFRPIAANIEASLKEDEEIGQIISQLKSRDVANPSGLQTNFKLRYPSWYHIRRVRDTLTKAVPQIRR